ncbi:MAG: hypothetical protein ACON4Z_18020 [Planctomycetota bacterium]
MFRPTCSILLLCAAVCGQEPSLEGRGAPRLLDTIERPYAYVRFDAPQPRRGGADGAGDPGPESVRNLLSDPSLDALFVAPVDSAANPAANPAGGSTRALSMVRGMLQRGAGEIELALTGIVGRGGAPLLILRARLEHDQANKLRLVFRDSDALAQPNRELGGHQTYTLRGGRGSGAGQTVEMAMVGDDFVVGNDARAMREVLEPMAATTRASGGREVLSRSPAYRRLRERVELPPGSLLAFSDWQRLGRRLQSSMSGTHAELLASSGLSSARSMMATIVPELGRTGDFSASLLLDFEFDKDAEGGREIDGWFASTQPVAAKELLRELPTSGLGGLVVSVDLRAVASHSRQTSHLYWDLRDAFRDFGLDFERNVLSRLASRGTVQLLLSEESAGNASVSPISPIYSVRAKSRSKARDLFADIRRVVEDNGVGELLGDGSQRRRRDRGLIKLWGRHRSAAAYMTVHEDALLFSGAREALEQLQGALANKRSRARLDAGVVKAVRALGGAEVAGLFDLDLGPVFTRLAAALGGEGVDFSSLPRRHVGFLASERSEEGAVVRIRLLSSR